MPPDPSIIDSRTRLLHLLGAAALTVAQPLYDVLGKNPEFGIAHHLAVMDYWVLAGVLSLGVGGAWWAVTSALGLAWPRIAAALHLAGVGGLIALGPLGLLQAWPSQVVGRLGLLAVMAGVTCVVYWRSEVARRLLSLLALGAVVFPALFLWTVLPRGSSSVETSAVGAVAADSRPVVLIIFDELPLGSLLQDPTTLDAVRFPNFAGFASTSTWFRHATAVAQSTRAAVPAMVSGRYPSDRRAPTADHHPETLFSLAAGRYGLNVAEATTELCGPYCGTPSTILTWGERFPPALADLGAIYLAIVLPGAGPVVEDNWSDYWGDGPAVPVSEEESDSRPHPPPTRQLERFLEGLETSPRATFHFIHLKVPHVPWRFLADGRSYMRERRRAHGLGDGATWAGSEWEVVQAQQRHLIQLQYADRLLGQIVAGLRDAELFDPSLIVVAADHGTSFERGQRRRFVTDGNLVDIAHVPLFVKRRDQTAGTSSDENVETVDIAPTIARGMGLELPGLHDGLDLLGERRRGTTKTIFRGWDPDGAGKQWTYEVQRLGETWERVRVRNSRFPEPSLFAIGADRHLVGQSIAAFEPAPPRASLALDHPAAFGAVDPGGSMLPVHVMGRLTFTEPIAESQLLVVALDGVIQAVTESYGRLPTEEAGFSALLDPATLRAGRQELAVYLVEEDSSMSLVGQQ